MARRPVLCSAMVSLLVLAATTVVVPGVRAQVVRDLLGENPDMIDPRKYLGPGRDAIKETVKGKMRLFNSSGKA